jgi:hypothetical protein
MYLKQKPQRTLRNSPQRTPRKLQTTEMQYIKDQIKHALENQEELIKVFAAEPEKKLADRLHIIHLQSVICENEKDEETAGFLEIMRRIVIEARLYKWENNIADEVDETLAELKIVNTIDYQQNREQIELAQEKHEHRKKLLAKLAKSEIKSQIGEQQTEPKKDSSVQLGLF